MNDSVRPSGASLHSVPEDRVNERVIDAPFHPPPHSFLPGSHEGERNRGRRREAPPLPAPWNRFLGQRTSRTSHPGTPREEHKPDPHGDCGEHAPRPHSRLHPGPLSPRPTDSADFGVPPGEPGASSSCSCPRTRPGRRLRGAPQSSHLKLPLRRPRLGVGRCAAGVPRAAGGSRARTRRGG